MRPYRSDLGDKDRKYALVKNEDGWTLALEGNSEDNPIQVDSDEAEDITREVNSYKEDLRQDKRTKRVIRILKMFL